MEGATYKSKTQYDLKPSHPRWVWPLGLPLLGLSLSLMIVGTLGVIGAPVIVKNEGLLGVLFGTLGFASILSGTFLFNLGRRFIAVGQEYKALKDTRPHVLYLRSFINDPLHAKAKHLGDSIKIYPFTIPKISVKTPEEDFAEILGEIGSPIAIGRPGEKLPPIGIPRLYVNDDTWKTTVLELMRDAKLVVIYAGVTPGLSEEFKIAVDELNPERLVIFFPVAIYLSPQSEYYKQMEQVMPRLLPILHGNNSNPWLEGFIYFDSDWTPHVVNLRATSTSGGELDFLKLVKNTHKEKLRYALQIAARNVAGRP